MAFNLLECVKNNTNQNQQGSSPKELGKLAIDSDQTCQCRQHSNDRQED